MGFTSTKRFLVVQGWFTDYWRGVHAMLCGGLWGIYTVAKKGSWGARRILQSLPGVRGLWDAGMGSSWGAWVYVGTGRVRGVHGVFMWYWDGFIVCWKGFTRCREGAYKVQESSIIHVSREI
jgi:hypothetical protein